MHVPTIVSSLLLLLLLSLTALAEVNGPCTGAAHKPGVCIETSSCTKAGGTHIDGACPHDANDIKCCTKPSCGSGGTCKFVRDCETGSTKAGLCPGPSDFKCCLPTSGGGGGSGGFPPPTFPVVGKCKKVAVEGAKKVVKANPEKVREIGCVRDSGGVKTDEGKSIAEWVMHNHKDLKLKYVISGQRIWNPSRDAVEPWTGWRIMEDRGSVTANHW
ncbi:hypothetical protein UCDDS831_g04089 [Diplodia seriata]|uniref:ARB-07466-like C-terminal domain-containing protein n=1 Tax=Diplodia seriata TaxID=420778 RepID=A0A0G2EHH4_9PEZI|nr:hypothetical protein UCDDS831_g04089 [Diplodia seriata]